MSGSWTVFEKGQTLFTGELTGGGTAHLMLGANLQTGESIISQVSYEFQDAAPVPEPSTLALIGVSGVVLAARRRIRGNRDA